MSEGRIFKEVESGLAGDVPYSIWEHSFGIPHDQSDPGISSILDRHWLTAYIAVPQGHPWYGRPYDELEEIVDCHGGLTYSGDEDFTESRVKGEAGELYHRVIEMGGWWLGVDWHHAYDHDMETGKPTYTIDDVRQDVYHMAHQAMAAMTLPAPLFQLGEQLGKTD